MTIRILYLCAILFLSGYSLPCLSYSPSDVSFGAADSSLRFRSIDHERLDSLGGIWAITQDKHGFIWFGGENGLARFDGYDLVVYRSSADNPHSLSSNYVRDLLVDDEGSLWVATNFGLNRYLPEKDGFELFFHDAKDPFSLSGDEIRSLELGESGSIWIGTAGAGLNRLDLKTHVFERYRNDRLNTASISSDDIYDLEYDRNGNLWVGTAASGLDMLPTKDPHSPKNAFKHFKKEHGKPGTISSNHIRSLFEDSSGSLWVGTVFGLNRLEPGAESFDTYFHEPSNPNSVSMDFVQSIAEDVHGKVWFSTSGEGLNLYQPSSNDFARIDTRLNVHLGLYNNNIRKIYLGSDGNLWFGHFASGVSLLDVFASAFQNFTHNPYLEHSINHNQVTSALEDPDGNFWVATVEGVNFFDRQTKKFRRYVSDPSDPNSVSDGGVLGMMLDSKNRLWVGFWLEGLNILDLNSGELQRFKKNDGENHGLNSDAVWSFLEDSKGTIWIGTNHGGLQYFDESEYIFKSQLGLTYSEEGQECSSVFALFEDSRNNFWVGCANGLFLRKSGSDQFQHFHHIQGDPNSLSSNYIWAINEDSQGQIWVGTQSGGVNLFNSELETFTVYSTEQGLADNLVTGIVEMLPGELWFTTGKGLSRLNVETGSFRNYDKKYGMVGDVFNRPAFFKTKSDEFVLGSKDGLSIFDFERLPKNVPPPKVVFTKAKVLNEFVDAGQPGSPINKALPFTKKIVFEPEQSSFSLTFAALTFQLPEKNLYAYRMKGYELDWNYVGDRREAFYTNLDPGRYSFEVKSQNSEGRWSDTEVISVMVVPPWWRTWWAYALYAALVSITTFSLFQAFWQRKLAESERQVSDQLRHMDKVKDHFLATTSHELRTPLNGMIGLSESLKSGDAGDLPREAYERLDLIVTSGRRLSTLVNDILDFSKLREQKVVLKLKPLDLYALTEAVLSLFEPLVSGRPIRLTNEVSSDLPDVMADKDRLQQILYNLIGNAVKFTDEGTVSIKAELGVGVVNVSVNDTGLGIEREHQDKIFCSYEQIENNECYGDFGTGLGLAVTKELVQLHGGEIILNSSFGLGSSFSFSLPLAPMQSKELTKTGDIQSTVMAKLPFSETSELKEEHAETVESAEAEIPHIIVVDDEPVNRLVVEGMLKLTGYRVTECQSGQELLDILEQGVRADLILLDIMMPKLSGFDTCAKLRQQYSSRELPVIFLSARSQSDDLRKGTEVGGNDFLTKPIAREELLKRVKRQLRNV